MAALAPADIDLNRQRISVTKAYAEVRGQLILDSAKNHERRSVPFPAFLVQTMLGHKSAAMTFDVYADLFPDDLDAVAIALDHAYSSASVPKMCPRAAEEPVT